MLEIDVNLVMRIQRGSQRLNPWGQRARRIAAAQPEVSDWTERDEWRSRPFLLIGDDQRGAVRPQHSVGLVVEPGLVAKFGCR